MRKPVVLLTALVLAAGAAGCGDDEESGSGSGAAAETTAEEAPAQVEGTRVGMRNLRFDPEEVSVKTGDQITWVNDESIQHNVVAQEGADFESELLDKDQTFEYTPEKAGTISYVCTLHPGMDGKVTVTG